MSFNQNPNIAVQAQMRAAARRWVNPSGTSNIYTIQTTWNCPMLVDMQQSPHHYFQGINRPIDLYMWRDDPIFSTRDSPVYQRDLREEFDPLSSLELRLPDEDHVVVRGQTYSISAFVHLKNLLKHAVRNDVKMAKSWLIFFIFSGMWPIDDPQHDIYTVFYPKSMLHKGIRAAMTLYSIEYGATSSSVMYSSYSTLQLAVKVPNDFGLGIELYDSIRLMAEENNIEAVPLVLEHENKLRTSYVPPPVFDVSRYIPSNDTAPSALTVQQRIASLSASQKTVEFYRSLYLYLQQTRELYENDGTGIGKFIVDIPFLINRFLDVNLSQLPAFLRETVPEAVTTSALFLKDALGGMLSMTGLGLSIWGNTAAESYQIVSEYLKSIEFTEAVLSLREAMVNAAEVSPKIVTNWAKLYAKWIAAIDSRVLEAIANNAAFYKVLDNVPSTQVLYANMTADAYSSQTQLPLTLVNQYAAEQPLPGLFPDTVIVSKTVYEWCGDLFKRATTFIPPLALFNTAQVENAVTTIDTASLPFGYSTYRNIASRLLSLMVTAAVSLETVGKTTQALDLIVNEADSSSMIVVNEPSSESVLTEAYVGSGQQYDQERTVKLRIVSLIALSAVLSASLYTAIRHLK